MSGREKVERVADVFEVREEENSSVRFFLLFSGSSSTISLVSMFDLLPDTTLLSLSD